MVPSITIGIILCYHLISKRVRKYSQDVGAITVTELIKKRYYDEGNLLTVISALIICTATIAYVSGQLIAIGKLLSIILLWDFKASVIITAIFVLMYTVLGGFIAVCWTDITQGLLMVFGSLIGGIFVLSYSGGGVELFNKMVEVNSSSPEFLISPFGSVSSILMGLSLFMGDGIFNWIGQPTLMTKYMAAKDTKTLSRASLLSVFIQLILFSGVLLVAIYMRVNFPSVVDLPHSGDIETVFIQFFIIKCHPLVVGMIIATIIAAIMSTSDSLLMMATSTLVNDIYNVVYPKSSEKHLILVSRIVTILLGLMAVLLAVDKSSVLWSSWFGWSTLSIVGIPIVVGLYWKRATKQGAIAGMLAGFIVLSLWNIFGLTDTVSIFYGFVSSLAGYITIIVVSLLTPEPPQYIMQEVEMLSVKSHRINKLEI